MTGRRQSWAGSLRTVALAALAAAGCWPVALASGSEADPRLPEIIGVRVGFAGHYKVGYWTPIEVKLRGGTKPALGIVRVVVPDADNDPTVVGTPDGRPTTVLPGQDVSVLLYAKIGRDLDGVPVQFDLIEQPESVSFRDERQLWPLDADQKFYLSVGGQMVLPPRAGEKESPEEVWLPDATHLPTRWYGYDAVDMVVFFTGDGSAYRSLRPDSAQLQALNEWLAMGGRLLLVAGPDALGAFEAGSGLADLAPGKVTGVEMVKSVEALEKFADATHRIPLSSRGKSQGLQGARLERPQGIVVVEGGGLPLVIHTGHGFGQTVFFASDFNRRPLADWLDRGKLIEHLLDLGQLQAQQAELKPWAQSVNFGYHDLAGQLRGALDRFQGVKLVPFWVVGLSIVGYILLIGPVDYFFVKRVLKRMELTWITFPVIVLVVSVSAYVAAQWAKGSQLRMNQIDLVDVETSTGLVRGTAWFNVFSPRTADYDLSLVPCGPAADQAMGDHPPDDAQPAGRRLFAWLGSPGFTWAGAQSNDAGPGWFRRPYIFGPRLDELAGVPIDVWSTKSFVGRWQSRAGGLLDSELSVSSDGDLGGQLTSRLPFKLENCLLAYGRWAYSLGSLPPGALRVPQAAKRDLQTVLRGFHTVKGQMNEGIGWRPVPYNSGGLDVDNILQQMMFYRAADARGYTNLTNRYQDFVDLSHELALGRAVLVGRAAAEHPAAQLLEAGEPLAGDQRRWVFYRFVMPVKRAD
jgi:hypothetical protein